MTASPSDRLIEMGWTSAFADQVTADEHDLTPARIAGVQRTKLSALTLHGAIDIAPSADETSAQYAVGDWVLLDIPEDEPGDAQLVRRLARTSLLQRRIEGQPDPQLAAANVDTLFIVTSCNADFNPARLERYLAMANDSGATPVIVLTKADTVADTTPFETEARALQRGLSVVALNGKSDDAIDLLAPWCGKGLTVALAGSSGVGKSTLVNRLSPARQATGGIRENDGKGRHTTTTRSLHEMTRGGWVIDNPGMRNLHVSHVADGIDTTFAEIIELAAGCKFRDCSHVHEPGCAVQAAVKSGELTEQRVARWRKLSAENRSSTPQQTGPRGNKRTGPAR
jgi:ribosome biogenesis GTPase / thiamine phosphate phosphatase